MKLFYGDAICLDLKHVRYPDSIEISHIEEALKKAKLDIRKGDIFLMYTGHYERTYPDNGYGGIEARHSGISYAAAKWLAELGIVNIGVDSPAIDLTPDDLDYSGHLVCGQFGITNTENLCNLDKVAGKRFAYMGLPLKIRAGSGSPIRAVALVEEE
jgi:kynurenine formamidase